MATNLTSILSPQTAASPDPGLVAPSPDAGAVQPSWLDSIPEAYRQDAHITSHNGIESLLAEYGALKQNGSNAPDWNAPFDEHKDYFMKQGVPESADKYDLGIPEGSNMNPEFISEIQQVAHQYKISAEALKALAAVDVKFGTQISEQNAQAAAQQEEISHQTLEKLWGDKADVRSEFTQKAFGHFSTLEEAQELGAEQILAHPYFLHVMSKIGEAMSAPVSPGASSSAGTAVQQTVVSTPQQAEAAIKAMWSDPAKAAILNDTKHSQHKQLNAEIDAYYKKAAGG
jgi:hypothetical protein